MSIENTLIRIADALEIIAGVMDDKAEVSFAAEVPLKEEKPVDVPAPVTTKVELNSASHVAPSPVVVETPVEVPATPVTAVPPPVEPLPEAPTTQITLEELNQGLVTEFHRLGGRDMIDATIKGFGVGSANELAPADYQAVLDKVKALK